MIKVLILQTGKDYFQGVHLVKKLKCFFSFLFFFFFFIKIDLEIDVLGRYKDIMFRMSPILWFFQRG